jgi:hypothetical protein
LDDVLIVFTHSDFHHSNILMSWDENGTPRVAAIVDWHQSGWYPAPWEFYKTRFTCKASERWELDYILEFLQSYQGYIPWDYLCLSGALSKATLVVVWNVTDLQGNISRKKIPDIRSAAATQCVK